MRLRTLDRQARVRASNDSTTLGVLPPHRNVVSTGEGEQWRQETACIEGGAGRSTAMAKEVNCMVWASSDEAHALWELEEAEQCCESRQGGRQRQWEAEESGETRFSS